MFTDDNSVKSIRQLFVEVKKYIELQKEYTKLEIIEKLTVLLSTLIIIVIAIILGMIALFYLSLTLAYVIAPLVGGLTASFAIITGLNILLIVILILFRKKLIVSPMTNFVTNLFIQGSKK